MLWDMLSRGSFQRRIMTSGGRTATAARTVQAVAECRFPAMPAMDTAEAQATEMMALIETSFIVQV